MNEWNRHDYAVIEVAEIIHGTVTGTGGGLMEDEYAKRVNWLRWRIVSGWEESRDPEDAPYDIAVKNLAFAALMLVKS